MGLLQWVTIALSLKEKKCLSDQRLELLVMTPFCPTLVGYGDRPVCRRPYNPYLESLRLWTVSVEQGTVLPPGSPVSSPCTLRLTAIASKGQLLGVLSPNSEPQPVKSLPAALWTGVECLP